MAAALYSLEAFEVSSCTDGENMWKKRPRQQDVAIPIRNLNVIKAQYGIPVSNTPKPQSDLFDPRTADHRTDTTIEQKTEFGLKLREVHCNSNAYQHTNIH